MPQIDPVQLEIEILELEKEKAQAQAQTEQPSGVMDTLKQYTVDPIVNTAKAGYNAAVGPEPDMRLPAENFDPAMLEQGIMKEGPQGFEGTAKVLSSNDAEYAQILAQRANEMGMNASTGKDRGGYDTIKYTHPGDQGMGPGGGQNIQQERRVNQPGLDLEDIDRGVAAALPYVPAGSLGSAMTMGKGLLTRGAFQAPGAITTSLVTDVGASNLGSEVTRGEALTDAGIAGLGAVGGEAVGSFLNTTLVPWLKARSYFVGGRLTDKGLRIVDDLKKELDQNGAPKYPELQNLDPEQITEQFAQDLAKTNNPATAARGAMYEQEGMPATTAMKTRDPELLRVEQEMYRNKFGDDAQRNIAPFFDPATQASETGEYMARGSQKITGREYVSQQDAGQEITNRLQSMHETMGQQVDNQWDKVPRQLHIEKAAKLNKYIPDDIIQEIDGLADDLDGAPSRKLYGMFEKWRKGELKTSPITEGSDSKPLDLAQIRANIQRYATKSVKDPSEYRRVAALRDAYDDYLEAYATTPGRGEEVKELVLAQDMSKTFKEKFRPVGKNDPGGKELSKLIDSGEIQASKVIDRMIGSGKVAPLHGPAFVDRVIKTLGRNSNEHQILKASVITRATENASGQIKTVPSIVADLNTMKNNRSIQLIMGEDGMLALDRLARDVAAIQRPATPRGSSQTVQQYVRTRANSALQYMMKAKGSGARFTGSPHVATFWHVAARKLPWGTGTGLADRSGRKLSEKLIRGDLATDQTGFAGAVTGAGTSKQEIE